MLRIYRRASGPPSQVAGRVETPGGSHSAGFANLGELAAILEAPSTHLRPAEVPEAADSFMSKLYQQEKPSRRKPVDK